MDTVDSSSLQSLPTSSLKMPPYPRLVSRQITRAMFYTQLQIWKNDPRGVHLVEVYCPQIVPRHLLVRVQKLPSSRLAAGQGLLWSTAHSRPKVLFRFLPVRALSRSPDFYGEAKLPPCKASCCRCKQPVNSGQLLETLQKAKAYQDTQRLWPTAQGRRLLSALSCPSGSAPWGPGSSRIMWAPGKVAGDHGPLPQLPQGVDLRLSLGSFSFTFLLAGVGTPQLESTRGKPGKPQLIRSLYLDCSGWLPLCILHPSARTRRRYRMGGGSAAGGGGSTMEFFPKAYAPGPSQLWLCTGTLLSSSCGPGRPALLSKT